VNARRRRLSRRRRRRDAPGRDRRGAAIEPEPAVVLLLVLGLEVNVLTLTTERRRPRPVPRASVLMLAFAIPGALAGVAVLRALPAAALQIAVTLGVAGTLAARRVTTAHVPAWLAGLAAGALTTSTSTNGPPMLLHLLGLHAAADEVQQHRRGRAVRHG
jgi:uncharacterized protein